MTAVNLDHELLRRAVAQPEVLHWQTWAAPQHDAPVRQVVDGPHRKTMKTASPTS